MSQPTAVLVGLANRTSQFKNAVASLPRQRSLFVLMCRFLSPTLLGCLLAFAVVPLALAQNLPNTTRLLRFPTTNGRQIVFCYAGELYTVAKEGGIARRITADQVTLPSRGSHPTGHSSLSPRNMTATPKS